MSVPTVWAWRTGRVHKVRRAVDLLLTIFPFESAFLDEHNVRSVYVGHPLACDMPIEPDRPAARQALGLTDDCRVLAVLPGSRRGEVGRLARPFLQTAAAVQETDSDIAVVIPLVNEATRAVLEQELESYAPKLRAQVSVGTSRTALAAADVVLTASGTATLESLLSKRPMVVGYKVQAATYWIARLLRLVKVEHVAMANLLAGERLAPEYIQTDCEPAHLVPAVRAFFDNAERRGHIAETYRKIHEDLRTDTNREAANAVIELLRERGLV